MMRTSLAAIALALVLTTGVSNGPARAQAVMPPSLSYLGAEATYDPPQTMTWTSAPGMTASQPVATFPYSYFAAFPGPAREYVPFGNNDLFPYGGQPYGHPYDRWSWSYLSGYNGTLARYYYPPVR